MTEFYIVNHTHKIHLEDAGDLEESVKLIGVFSSIEKAREAIEHAKLQSGFRNFPEGFSIKAYVINRIYWNDDPTSIP